MRRLILVAAAVLGAFAVAALLLPHSPTQLRELALGAGAAAPLLALAAWLLLTPALFSGTLLAAAGGLAFGAVEGAAISVAGALLGGLAAFALGRTAARSQVERLAARRPRWAKLHGLLERRGFQAMLAARLMPGMPVTALHYAAGASPVSVRAFAAAITLGALVRTAPYALLGQGIGSGSVLMIAFAGGSVALGALLTPILARRLQAPA